MTYPDNRDHRPIPPSPKPGERDNATLMWIAGAGAGLFLLAILAYGISGPSTTAVTQSSPPASTTGSGAVTTGTERPSQPAQPLPNPRAPAAPR